MPARNVSTDRPQEQCCLDWAVIIASVRVSRGSREVGHREDGRRVSVLLLGAKEWKRGRDSVQVSERIEIATSGESKAEWAAFIGPFQRQQGRL
ncbi:hypothetical protein GLAREA_11338 [Glarea lozoyensis ATCC 20868]|uniref:Uncharacterized protein n=1 Tax=Glarea lozoyensis (strain ATCC 20868 / MF5171) TaxID=1116229 RepID=S3EBF0_GLAL2|nr:uncharacterized protein GLAREA_11338 [Glarea lozoyensis ATCC 20868]EPE35638.1 hypothetical protein GLAREA_11338 [Glarea lozoyensis ATCC 20868]